MVTPEMEDRPVQEDREKIQIQIIDHQRIIRKRIHMIEFVKQEPGRPGYAPDHVVSEPSEIHSRWVIGDKFNPVATYKNKMIWLFFEFESVPIEFKPSGLDFTFVKRWFMDSFSKTFLSQRIKTSNLKGINPNLIGPAISLV